MYQVKRMFYFFNPRLDNCAEPSYQNPTSCAIYEFQVKLFLTGYEMGLQIAINFLTHFLTNKPWSRETFITIDMSP